MSKKIIGSKGKGGGGSVRAPVEAADSLRSKQYAKVLDLISEGEIKGLVDGYKSIFFDDTPLLNSDGSLNFQNVAIQWRVGTQDQSYVPGFEAVESETAVGLEITESTPRTFTINDTNVDAVRVTLSLPQLMYQDPNSGDLGGTTVQYKLSVQNNGGGFIDQVAGMAWLLDGISTIVANQQYQTSIPCTGLKGVLTFTADGTYNLQYKDTASGTWITIATIVVTSILSNPCSGPEDGSSCWQTNYNGSVTANACRSLYRTNYIANIIEYAFETFSLPLSNYDIRVTAGSLASVYRNGGTPVVTITGKTTSGYQRSHRINLPRPGPWDVRVTRITPDSVNINLSNETWLSNYTTLIESKLRYPNSALMAIEIDAEQFNGIPVRGYHIYGIKIRVPSNYNTVTRQYTGEWDGTFKIEYSNNPAWIFYDIATNSRYGLGDWLGNGYAVDKWSLYAIGQYCDELIPNGFGGTEPRFTCNAYIQERVEALTLLANLAAIFRGMVYWASSFLTVSQDRPAPVMALFSNSNVIGGLFNYSGSSINARHTVALVGWNDPDDMYRQKIEYVEDADAVARYGIRETELYALGCTSRGQAHRVGKWLLYTERYESEIVSFNTGIVAASLFPGSVIEIADTGRSVARIGGRISVTDYMDKDISVWSLNGANRSSTGYDGPGGNPAYTIQDDSGSSQEYTYPQADIVGNNEVWQAESYIEKDADNSRFCAIELRFSGGTPKTYRIVIKSSDGTYQAQGDSATNVLVTDVGQWYKVCVAGDSGNNTSLEFRCYPSYGSTYPTGSVSATGSAVFSPGKLSRVDRVQLDATVTIDQTYLPNISVIMPDESVITRDIVNSNGEYTVIDLNTPFPDIPVDGTMWIISSNQLVPLQARVISVTEVSPNNYEVSALKYDADKYGYVENDLMLEPDPISALNPTKQAPVVNVEIVESLYISAAGTITERMTIAWPAITGAVRYSVAYKAINGNWVNLPKTRELSVDVDITPGYYTASVVAENMFQVLSTPTFSNETQILGKAAPPAAPDIFLLSVQPDGTREFRWGWSNPELDLDGALIRAKLGTGYSWDQLDPLHEGVLYNQPWETNQLAAGEYVFGIKSIDTSGNVSAAALYITTTIPDPRLAGSIEVFDERTLGWPGTKTNCHVDSGTGYLIPNEAAASPWVRTWAGDWITDPVTQIQYERLIDIGIVVTFTPLVTVTAVNGTFTIEEAHSNDNISYSSWVAPSGQITASYIKIRVTVNETADPIILQNILTILAANPIEEDLQDIVTSGLSGSYRIGAGDIRLPITKSYSVIKGVNITLQNVGPGWSWELIDKDTSVGPRVKIYNASNTLSDATIDVLVRGI